MVSKCGVPLFPFVNIISITLRKTLNKYVGFVVLWKDDNSYLSPSHVVICHWIFCDNSQFVPLIDEPKNKDEEFVHAPPVNIMEKENQEKVGKLEFLKIFNFIKN